MLVESIFRNRTNKLKFSNNHKGLISKLISELRKLPVDRPKYLPLRIRQNDEFSSLREKALNNLVPAACNCPSKYSQNKDSPARIWI